MSNKVLVDADDRNPFEDPAVLEAMRSQQRTQRLDDYNAFLASQMQPTLSQSDIGVSASHSQPPAAVLQTTIEPPPPYSANAGWNQQPGMSASSAGSGSWNQSAAEADLARRQEELERKAVELQRREDELARNAASYARINNFPPLPASCPLKPCFYQDFNVDIPLEFQKIVRTGFYLWLAYIGLLALNMFGSLAYFIASSQAGASNSSGVTFGMSIFYLILFTPCSFVCWFRPLYKAFRSDSSFNFFFFFFVFFFQFCVTVMQSLGIDGWGSVGFISSLGMFTKGFGGATVAGVIMMLIGCMFAVMALLDMLMLIKVHRIYRSTDASFAKAQQEFAHDVMGNRTVQLAAGNLAATAARGTVEQTWGNSRY